MHKVVALSLDKSIKYRIADILIQINLEYVGDIWEKFKVQSEEDKPDILVDFSSVSKNYEIEKYYISGLPTICFRYHSDLMLVNKNWNYIQILGKSVNSKNVFLLQVFHTQAIYHRMIQIHSSMIKYQNQGILFLGPSGIGKTTQAELWNQYRNAQIINGDMNFVQQTEDGFIGWGTPWHGSSPYCENTSVRVHSLIVLQQANENRIRKLEGFEMVRAVKDNIIYPTWLEDGVERCLDVLDKLLKNIPVYLLECRPDEDAVILVEDIVLKGIN